NVPDGSVAMSFGASGSSNIVVIVPLLGEYLRIRFRSTSHALPAASEAQRRELLTATGFLVIGPKMLAEQDKDKLVADIVDEQLDTVGKVFLGLTLGCARCHDHKFDPITAEDYYALAGVFHSTKTMEHLDHVSQWSERLLPNAEVEQQAAEFERELKSQQAKFKQDRLESLDVQIAQGSALLRQLWRERIEPLDSTVDSVELEPQTALAKLFETQETLKALRELSQQTAPSFENAAKQQWASLKASQIGRTKTSWVGILSQQEPATDPTSLVEGVLSAISERWRAIGAEYPAFAKSVEELAPEDRELFGNGAPLDATNLSSKFLEQQPIDDLIAQAKCIEELEQRRPVLAKAMAVDEAAVKLVAVHVRGSHLQFSGEPLTRHVPTILDDHRITNLHSPSFPEQSSGRLELAKWLTDPAHPLTARVIVNRIWQGHFGQGLVGTPSNFGLRGELPSHPELLDWLARDFQRNGWSLKHLHRQITLSSTYRMAWIANPQAETSDPDNRLLWRQNRRRLEAEPIRDMLLTVAGRLDHQIGGEFQPIRGEYPDSGQAFEELDSPRRTIMLPINRAALNEFFSTFDFLDPAASLESRPATVVPHQTLFLMNHPMAMHAGWALAQRLTQATHSSVDRVRLAYVCVLGRYPTQDETRKALELVEPSTAPSAEEENSETWVRFCRSLLLANETLYVD
ncbi:MAG: DUF1553 domain-containing protein, partial [Aureliella sp.]